MKNLGLQHRWKNLSREGAVERAKRALARRGGVQAKNYILHIPASASEKTLCGRPCARVNCYTPGALPVTKFAAEEQCCKRCSKKVGQ